jgi:hypothetical protein
MTTTGAMMVTALGGFTVLAPAAPDGRHGLLELRRRRGPGFSYTVSVVGMKSDFNGIDVSQRSQVGGHLFVNSVHLR